MTAFVLRRNNNNTLQIMPCVCVCVCVYVCVYTYDVCVWDGGIWPNIAQSYRTKPKICYNTAKSNPVTSMLNLNH